MGKIPRIKVADEDLKLRIDKYWHNIFNRRDESGDSFVLLPKMAKCALSLCHSNADVERSFSTNKRMLTKQNVALNEETIIGLRASKATVEECGGVNKVPITKDLLKAATNSHRMYTEHLREGDAKKRQKEAERSKQQAYKRKLDEIRIEEKSLHDNLEQLKTEQTAAQKAMEKAMSYVEEGGQKINNGLLKVNDMMEVQAGNKLIEFGR